MILYLITEEWRAYRGKFNWAETRNRLEDAAGEPCIVLHYTQAPLETVLSLPITALCHSGCGTDFSEYDVLRHAEYRRLVLECGLPQIGFCGGHQILARFFGSTLGPMRRLRPDEPVLSGYRPKWFVEWGVYRVRIVRKDPLFAGCGPRIRAQENHYWEVKKLGPELIRLAESRNCRIQAFRHRTKPIYGVQFHPENSPPGFPDGARILRNFFSIARKARGSVRPSL